MLSILLPTDFSENSMNAITYALEFFKYQRTTFYFMHAYQNEFYDHEEWTSREVFNDVLEGIRNESNANLENLIREVKKIAPNPRFIYHTISAYNTLVEDMLFPSNIDKVSMDLKIPLLAMQNMARY